jgi:hypothetical protein
MGLKLNRTHQRLVCAVDINMLGDKGNSTKKNTDALLDTSKEVGLQVNAEKN